jgi:hypothetical protein
MAEAGAAGHEELTSDRFVVALADSWLGVLMAADELAVRICVTGNARRTN